MPDPSRLGKYAIQGVLGRGAMGVVYKGYDPVIERIVAIKTVRKDLVDPHLAESLMGRFRNEARAAGRLLHPNIVSVYEYGEDDANAFIVMEYVDGTGLRDYLNRKARFEIGQIVAIVSQLLHALDFAHQRGVVHRDIKPANLILTPHGAIKVADFGIARIDTGDLTHVGAVIGTPSYMSPEQCQGAEIDGRSDIFSTGAVLYELLTGEKPFGGTVEAITYKICHDEAVAPSQLGQGNVSPAMDAVVLKALAKQPDARYATAREFAQALRAAAGDPPGAHIDETVLDLAAVKLHPPAPMRWDDTVLGTAESQLARYIGPMARLIVRKAAAQTGDVGELVALLSGHITDPKERSRFAEGLRGTAGTSSSLRSAGSGSLRPGGSQAAGERSAPRERSQTADRSDSSQRLLDDAFIEKAATRLAVYLGPIARVVVKRAAQNAKHQRQFVERIVEHLGEKEGAAFLREMGHGER